MTTILSLRWWPPEPPPGHECPGVSVEEFQTRIAELDRVYAFVATWAKAMFLAAGEPELARRIRPRIPRSPNPAEDDDVLESEPGLTPAEDEPSAAAPAPPAEAAPEPDGADDNP